MIGARCPRKLRCIGCLLIDFSISRNPSSERIRILCIGRLFLRISAIYRERSILKIFLECRRSVIIQPSDCVFSYFFCKCSMIHGVMRNSCRFRFPAAETVRVFGSAVFFWRITFVFRYSPRMNKCVCPENCVAVHPRN